TLKNAWTTSRQVNFFWVANFNLKFGESLPNGWYQVLVKGNGLGFAKVTGNVLKNYFPKGLRFK
ncbi:hypothetical protein BH618_03465, partial [Streptococcus pneumoniae]|uniref:methyltransferase RsmF C-terminal domain-like protein n=1 Tax=Streptococcus pneumoniae TaxID=1313 RepID=UPI00095A28EC